MQGRLHILFSEMEFSLCRDDISGNGGVAPHILTFDGVISGRLDAVLPPGKELTGQSAGPDSAVRIINCDVCFELNRNLSVAQSFAKSPFRLNDPVSTFVLMVTAS